ncbi:MAG: shikimate dehydrogenase, partial [Muribaculaceae bacterium]|nr:shikimate dehydrogenase [Muribaculaceae bacterium]
MIKYGLIGKKLGHSFSANYFNAKFRAGAIPAEYFLYEINDIRKIISVIESNPGLRGLNVTIPYKEDVLPFLTSLTDTAKAIGAVNTIRIETSQSGLILTGHNTDAEGFRTAITPLLGGRSSSLILGTGGASKAVKYAFRELNINYTQVSRIPSADTLTYSELSKEIIKNHDIIVNCTPLGMWPEIDQYPPIPYPYLSPQHLCFDLVYNPEITEFMRLSAEYGAITENGHRMLINQANAAYKFWNLKTYISRYYNSENSGNYRIRKVMSRKIVIVAPGQAEESYYLSLATLFLSTSNEVMRVDISPFEKEAAGVEYLDSPFVISIN